DRGRLPLRVRDSDHSRLDAQDAPGCVSELKDVAAVRFDGPVFVDGADESALGLEPDLVIRRVGYRASREKRGRTRAPRGPRPDPAAPVPPGPRTLPPFTLSSASSRRSRERLPWWLVTASSPRRRV